MTSTERAAYEAELAELRAQRTAFMTALTASAAGGVKSYRFDGGVGSQSVERHSPKELRAIIEGLDADIERLVDILAGTRLYTLGLRRNCGGGVVGGFCG